ncbi:berberine bridge enzyme-like D-1 [Spinacia oleracea]|uniref:Berberine bridge enzyme-like D-1 n=1 Tax=Spinacia oleracea TaxID=3562 RepID=A0ABM3R0B0_SPIOL|nr:berberine bridge enzyme-like D-1 [Spinacia oleracea]
MANFFYRINLIFMLLAPLCIVSLSQPSHLITSCLTHNHVTNFTLHPTSQNHLNTSSYYNLLLFSLQNLRFSTLENPKPNVIILPESKEQLVSSFLCAKKSAYEVRVRSGGHSYEGVSSVSRDGKPFVIIDMINLDKVVVDLRLKTAWVEGGATVGQVYYTIAKQSKGVYGFSGGSCSTIGVGGHFLGGGFGFLSRKYGLAADNVMDVLLVGPTGQVLDRASMGEDVFWAVRGVGGGSFGIVYAWKIKLLKVPPKVTAFQVSRNGHVDSISQLVHNWQEVGPYLHDDFYLSISIGANNGENGTNVVTTFSGQYLGDKLKAISILNNVFPELRIREDECQDMSWIESVLYFSGLGEGTTINDLKNRYLQSKNYYKAKSDYVTTPIPIKGIRGAMEILAKEHKGNIILDPYGGKMARIANDSIAFPHRKGNLFSIQYLLSWENEDVSNNDRYIGWIRGFYEYMAPFVSSNPRAAYVNYLDFDLGEELDYNVVDSMNGRVWGEKYFLNNYERLVKAKTIFDPCNFFRYPQGIPPMSINKKCHNP